MTTSSNENWVDDFGLDGRSQRSFITSVDQLNYRVPQSHLIRRGFNDLELDGVLCADNSPLMYFQNVESCDSKSNQKLINRFWHHGGAPILVLISDADVHIYSSLALPSVDDDQTTKPRNLVEILGRVKHELTSFVASVESGAFFEQNRKYFDPEQRVDQALLRNLQETRKELDDLSKRKIPANVLDSLLCRIVFTCYLFDRGVIDAEYLNSIGIEDASHLRDVLDIEPTSKAKANLYHLFERLAEDFNGDLFADDLNAEAKFVINRHIKILSAFFHGTEVNSGQKSFWPYDFGVIPVATISAIYETFLKDDDRNSGAFYTPRFLAEVVLDVALLESETLIGKTFLDPACGSGIFLVGLFHRLAEEWKQANPHARNETRARELIKLIQDSLFGVDINETACRIAAFSLYLAYLEQLSPRTIRELQKKGRALPKLIGDRSENWNLRCSDFFDPKLNCGNDFSLVIGNPPWGDDAQDGTLAARWCADHGVKIPDCQIASAFTAKSGTHSTDGDVCLVLPHGFIFSRQDKAVHFQREWLENNSVDIILNLTDYQNFLFEEARHPAVVVCFSNKHPKTDHRVQFWSPKSDWTVLQAEVIPILPEDRVKLRLTDVLENLNSDDAPQIWKEQYWATPRDRRLLERLEIYPRLRKYVRQIREPESSKPWLIGQGIQPLGAGDDPANAKVVELPSTRFLDATNKAFSLFLLESECRELPEPRMTVRDRSGIGGNIFLKPHVAIADGFKSVAFADFDVSFRSSVRAIHGRDEDADLLAFLTVYLKTNLAKYYLFHTSSSWGVNRARVYDDELLGLPFYFPVDHGDPDRANEIVNNVAAIVNQAKERCNADLVDRSAVVNGAMNEAIPLVYEYFDVLPKEQDLIDETVSITIPSTRPSRKKRSIPSLKAPTKRGRDAYVNRVCEMLNHWARRGEFGVRGTSIASSELGIAIAQFEKIPKSEMGLPFAEIEASVLETLTYIRNSVSKKKTSIELVRGVKVFDGNRLYVVKPLYQRHWTITAAMNDADEIAGSLLMESAMKDHDVTTR